MHLVHSGLCNCVLQLVWNVYHIKGLRQSHHIEEARRGIANHIILAEVFRIILDDPVDAFEDNVSNESIV